MLCMAISTNHQLTLALTMTNTDQRQRRNEGGGWVLGAGYGRHHQPSTAPLCLSDLSHGKKSKKKKTRWLKIILMSKVYDMTHL